METGMSLAEAQAHRREVQIADVRRGARRRLCLPGRAARYATHAGTLSVDQLKAIKELNKAYVPFQRVIDDVGAAAAAAAEGGIANRANPVKRIKGSGRDIINPLESIVKNTHTLVVDGRTEPRDAGARRQARRRRRRPLPRGDPREAGRDVVQPVAGAKRHPRELDAAGVDYPDNLDFDKLVTVFTPTQFRMGEKGVVSVLRDGKREVVQVNDQALYDAIATIGPKSSDLLVNLFMKPARLLRAGATTTIGFIARNPIRDTFEAYVNSRYGFKPATTRPRPLRVREEGRGLPELPEQRRRQRGDGRHGPEPSAQELVKMGAPKRARSPTASC
jgi:hypothetical protein